MRAAFAACTLVWAADVASADPLHEFVARWPRLGREVAARKLEVVLSQTESCERGAEPAIHDSRETAAPDGKQWIAMATLQFDDATVKRLGASERTSTVALVLDGPSGAIWARSLEMWEACDSNVVDFTWSKSGRRVLAQTNSGHGMRVALVDLGARRLAFEAFANFVVGSAGLEHVAWTPWTSGRPIGQDTDVVSGDVLYVDDDRVWGDDGPNADQISDITWRSARELTFCASQPGRAASRYRAVLGKKPAVSRVGPCPTE